MSTPTSRRKHLTSVGSEVQSVLEGLGLKLEEAQRRLEAQTGSKAVPEGIQHVEGTFRGVASELEDLAARLRAAADQNGEDST